jgi:hypothetical protein
MGPVRIHIPGTRIALTLLDEASFNRHPHAVDSGGGLQTQHASEGRRSTHMSNNGLMPTSHTASATLNVTVDAERGAGEELGGDDGDSEQPLGAAGEVLFGVISATVIIPVCIRYGNPLNAF